MTALVARMGYLVADERKRQWDGYWQGGGAPPCAVMRPLGACQPQSLRETADCVSIRS